MLSFNLVGAFFTLGHFLTKAIILGMCKLTIWLQHNVLLEKALDVHMDCYVTRINIVYVKYARKLLPLKVETLRLVHHKHHNWFAWQYCAGSGRTTRLSYFIVEVLSSHLLHLLIISMENNAYPQPHLTTNLSPGNLSYMSLDCWRKLEHSEGTHVTTQVFLT